MPGLACGAVKDLSYCRLLTMLSFLSDFCYHIPTVLVSQLLATSDLLTFFLKKKTHVFWNGDENPGYSSLMPRMGLNPLWGGKDPLAPLHGGFASLQDWGECSSLARAALPWTRDSPGSHGKKKLKGKSCRAVSILLRISSDLMYSIDYTTK